MPVRRTLFAFLLSLLAASAARASITADDLVLVVNKRQPAGRALAEEYAKLRHVPDGRIVEVDVPDLDDVDRAFYDEAIAGVVRREIESRGLRERAKCVVLFYGLPLRVREWKATPAERGELAQVLEPTYQVLHARVEDVATRLEALAVELSPGFRKATVPEGLAGLQVRLNAAGQACMAGLPTVVDPAKAADARQRMAAAQALLTSLPKLDGLDAAGPAATRPTTQGDVDALIAHPDDPDARRTLRRLAYQTGNSFQMLALIDAQRGRLTAAETESSVDSELACLWMPAYPLGRWVPNPFHHSGQATPLRSRMVRTCRIDGPTPEVARRIINDSVVAERRGLAGDVLLDARGLTGNGGFGSYEYYDGTIRRAFDLFKGNAELPAITDNAPDLLKDNSSDRAALYIGWYRLRKYGPVAAFVPGAIAIHVASLEMLDLRNAGESGWCRGLLLAGADATVGAVGEPYLLAFPPADEFLSLLLTGKPTLAEAYWSTIPVASWKLILIGDPLYRPFAARPALTPDKLPPALRATLDAP